jgi:AcrR family transcriptional regulator
VSVAPTLQKPLRADARRNRERILKAARKVFAERGMHSQIDDVAKRAKVGVGTVYRHFPTKETLLDAIVREHFEEIAGYAREALERDDAWKGFCELLWRGAERHADDVAFGEIVASTDLTALVEDIGLMGSIEELVSRAKAQSRMRPDATGRDVTLIMCGTTAVMRQSPDPDAWRRYLTLMLDGLRAS